jgi:hypothetical protein
VVPNVTFYLLGHEPEKARPALGAGGAGFSETVMLNNQVTASYPAREALSS